jgi:hypothetical protein
MMAREYIAEEEVSPALPPLRAEVPTARHEAAAAGRQGGYDAVCSSSDCRRGIKRLAPKPGKVGISHCLALILQKKD